MMLGRRGACAAARGGGADALAATIWDAIAPATPVTFLKRNSATSYDLYQQAGRSRYLKVGLRAVTGPGGHTPPLALNWVDTVVPMLLVDDTNPAWTYTGTWTVVSGNRRSNIAGDKATFTTPSGTVAVALDIAIASNCGYAKVVVNGDPTAANLLNTAQQEVDAGRLPSSVLVAGGGTLNPTDRIVDCSTITPPSPAISDRHIVDELAPGVHVIEVYVTGYKRAAATDTRVALFGAFYASAAVTPATASVVLLEDARLFNASSAYEFAYRMTIGGTSEWAGTIPHGYEEAVAHTITSDGTPQTLTDGQILQSNTSLVIDRTSILHHPNAANMADTTVSYTFDANGLRVEHSTEFNVTATPDTAYPSMLPIDGVSVSASTENFIRASGDAIATDIALDVEVTAPGESVTTTGRSAQMWTWSPASKTNRHVAAAKMADAATTLQGFAYGGINENFAQDRVGLNKLYWTLKESGVSMPDVINGTVWSSDTTYRWAVVTDADALCARP